MDQPKPVETESRYVYVVHEVLSLLLLRIIRVPVAVHGQHGVCPAVYGYHVRHGQAVGTIIFQALNHKVGMNLIQRVAVILCEGVSALLGFLLLNVGVEHHWLPEVYIYVEPISLQGFQLILGLAHDVGYTFSTLDVGRTVWHDDIFGWQVYGRLTTEGRVCVDLLERRARKTQRVQQPLMLRAILSHHLGQLIVHVVTDALRGLYFLLRLLTQYPSLHRARGGECLTHGLRLESYDRLG